MEIHTDICFVIFIVIISKNFCFEPTGKIAFAIFPGWVSISSGGFSCMKKATSDCFHQRAGLFITRTITFHFCVLSQFTLTALFLVAS